MLEEVTNAQDRSEDQDTLCAAQEPPCSPGPLPPWPAGAAHALLRRALHEPPALGRVPRLTGQLDAELPQAAASLGVVRLIVGARLALAVVEASRYPVKLRPDGQAGGRADALLEAVDRVPRLLQHDLGRHVGGRVEAVDGHLGVAQPFGELEAEADLGEL